MTSHAPIAVRTTPMPMSSTIALNKNAFPTRQHMPANLFNSAQFSCVGVQAQIRLSFALRS
jgi:hypothetical protein